MPTRGLPAAYTEIPELEWATMSPQRAFLMPDSGIKRAAVSRSALSEVGSWTAAFALVMPELLESLIVVHSNII